MRSKLKIATACLLASGFLLASHDAFSRAVPTSEAAGQRVPNQHKADRLAVKQKYPSPAERRCDVAEKACQKRCVRTTKGTGSKGAACARDCTSQWEKCWKDAPGPQ